MVRLIALALIGFIAIFSPANSDPGSWKKLSDMPTARYFSFSSLVGDKIYMIGGCLDIKPPHPAVATVEVFTPD